VPPTISVALCTFNGAEFLQIQLDSIFSQSVRPNQIIVADDGSTDRTLRIVEEFFYAHRNDDVDLRLLHSTERLGVVKNFERAVLATSGDLIVLCDQDDRWHSNRLATSAAAFASSDSLLLQHSDADLVDRCGGSLGTTLFAALGVSSRERGEVAAGNAFDMYLRRNLVTGATTVFRRSLLDMACPFPNEWVHDEWLGIVASAIGSVAITEESLVDYRQHGFNQIGVAAPTLRYRLRRMLEPRGARHTKLATRAVVLLERLQNLTVSSERLSLAKDKAKFEQLRSRYPANRLARFAPIVREWRKGSYGRLSSQGNLDVARDLIQPA